MKTINHPRMKLPKFIRKRLHHHRRGEESQCAVPEVVDFSLHQSNNTQTSQTCKTSQPIQPRTKRVASIDSGNSLLGCDDDRRPSMSSLGSIRSLVNFLYGDNGGCQFSTSAPSTTTSTGQCPYKHGTVYTDPYPGYIHGNPKRGICPNGCRPELNTHVMCDESPKETLLREAIEFIQLYYHERQDEMKGVPGFLPLEERLSAIKRSIVSTGTYEHTFDELQHGARVAWRNAPKCSNRKYWAQLKLLDKRKVTTNKGMYDACIEHLSKAMASGSSEAYVTVFKPAPPKTMEEGKNLDGPRIWNDQLLQYAAWRISEDADEVIGDPKNLRFTEMLKERFGWKGPPDGKKGKYDYLPLVVQVDPEGPPELFELPLDCAPPVEIHHPRYPELSSLNMQWYPIPAVCALDMTCGGILYTAVPFNGWYASTEVLRDLTDESRYNMIVPIAKALGMDTETKPGEAPLYKDEVMHILSSAIYHSFKASKVAMIDHHNLIDMFWTWYHDEMKSRRYCPVNWKWVIPPMSSSTNRAYLGLNKAQEYTLKPAYLFGPSPFQLETNHFGQRDTSKAMAKLVHCVYMAILFKRCIARIRGRKQPVLIIYASVTGNAAKYASELGSILRSCYNCSFFDACGINMNVAPLVETATLIIFVSSTQGNGELPSLSHKFFSLLFDKHKHLLTGKQCAVLGFGNSNYPIFCGAGGEISRNLRKIGAKEVIKRGECDAVQGESSTFYDWATTLVTKMARLSASPLVLKLSKNMKENAPSNLVRAHNLMESVKVEVFTAREVKYAAAESFMSKRRGSGGTMSSSSRRVLDSSGRRRSTGMISSHNLSPESSSSSDEGDLSASVNMKERLVNIIGSSSRGHTSEGVLTGTIKSREDLISSIPHDGEIEATTRKTSLLKIDLQSCGNPPYQPGDHICVFPRNVISLDELQSFVCHLSRNREAGLINTDDLSFDDDFSLDDNIYVSFDNPDIPSSELKVSFPLLSQSLGNLMPLDYFFETQVALEAPISMQCCLELSSLATSSKDQALLNGIGKSKQEYDNLKSLTGLKWIDLFKTFPSLSKQVTINFLLRNCKMNHPRSYSIASCKSVVGSELHIVVGRLIFSRGGSKQEVGTCSSFLTNVESGDEILFKIESAPSFHYPLDITSPLIFVCTGTGIAPIRGLLQKRSYLQSRGEKLGPAILIFGSRNSLEGLFHDEIEEFQKQGVLTNVYMCYSREMGEKKEYTTDKIRAEGVSKTLSPILAKPNTHIFICGSANMAEDCKNALRGLAQESDFDAITQEGRIHCDVFGALTSSRMMKYSSKHSKSSKSLTIDDLSDLDTSGDSRDLIELYSTIPNRKRASFGDIAYSKRKQRSGCRASRGGRQDLISSCIIGPTEIIRDMVDLKPEEVQNNDWRRSRSNSLSNSAH